MKTVEQLERMAANNAWSNHRIHRACAALEQAEYEARRTSFFPSIPKTLNHILIVDWYYLDALERGGKGRRLFDDEMPFVERTALAEAQRAADLRLLAFVRGLRDEELAADVALERADHIQTESVVDVLMHLFVHQIHHRGQVHAMLAGTKVKPPQLDEFFLREELPLREQELREIGLPLV